MESNDEAVPCTGMNDKGVGMRKDPLAIMIEIMNALESGRPFSINGLSKETGIHNVTIRKYVRIIETVRNEQQLEVIKTSHSIILRIRKE